MAARGIACCSKCGTSGRITIQVPAFQHFVLVPTPGSCGFHPFPHGMNLNFKAGTCLNSLNFASVHSDRGACHPLRRRGHQIAQQIGDLLRPSKASDPRFVREFLDCVFYREIVRRCPLFEEGLPASCHHSAGHDAVDLHAVFDSLLCESLRECVDGCVDRRDCCKSGLGIESCASRHQHYGSVRSFQSVPRFYGQTTRAVQLKRHPVIPLRVRHLEQINLWHCTCDVEQGIDSAEALENFIDEGFCRLRFAQVESEDNCFSSNRPHVGCSVFQALLIPRHQDNDGEIPGET